jgi:hypothetical protein
MKIVENSPDGVQMESDSKIRPVLALPDASLHPVTEIGFTEICRTDLPDASFHPVTGVI